jgi:hypothetical protein
LKLAGDTLQNWQEGKPWPYIYAPDVPGKWLDIPHFLKAAEFAIRFLNKGATPMGSYGAVVVGGYAQELRQLIAGILYSYLSAKWDKTLESLGMWRTDESSAFTPEDLPSNAMGAFFGATKCQCKGAKNLSDQLDDFLNDLGADDPANAPNWNDLPGSESEWENIDEYEKIRAWIMRFVIYWEAERKT